MGVLFLGICIAVLLTGVLFLAKFADAAFGGPAKLHERGLPLLRGESLKTWAALRARRATADWLATQADRAEAGELARRIESDAGQLLDEAFFHESPRAQGPLRCRDGETPPSVTAPEVFAIAAELRKLPLPRQEAMKVRLSSLRAEPADCPLLSAQGMCLCAAARPLGCRGRCLAGFDSSNEAAAWAESLGEGMIEGMRQALGDSGLDGTRYDLHPALATVLADPTAESRWRRGQTLIATATAT